RGFVFFPLWGGRECVKGTGLKPVGGFGRSFTEGAGVVFNRMSEKTKAQFLSLYFSDQEHNYTLARMPIQSCDFSLGNYAYVDSSADLLQGRLSFSRDEAHLIPLISGALRLNPHMKLMASPWSPPAVMKTNNDIKGGGKLGGEWQPPWGGFILKHLLENLSFKKTS
ncbi:hypothetical protein C4813_23980, partial [Salmonella enterica subsp. enterica serovar Rubislaw]